ncbi:hypothetical protein Dimus_036191 [Dionaea muscipula]
MNTIPHAPVVRPDLSQLTRLSMLQAVFLESLVLFHDRAPIPDFEYVVDLESLEDHRDSDSPSPSCEHLSTTSMLAVFLGCFLTKQEARRRGLNIPPEWSQWSARAPLWWFSEAHGSIPFFYDVVDTDVLEEHDLAAMRHQSK